jgi:hypothetical protein
MNDSWTRGWPARNWIKRAVPPAPTQKKIYDFTRRHRIRLPKLRAKQFLLPRKVLSLFERRLDLVS